MPVFSFALSASMMPNAAFMPAVKVAMENAGARAVSAGFAGHADHAALGLEYQVQRRTVAVGTSWPNPENEQ